ncbi:MAG: glutathione S-transferase family protein [Alphaproteobacteria bacterium]|nr:glutathione S-transferase family protein [Alphaproteobacteria bacterium]
MIKIWNFPRGARGVRLFWVCEEMGLSYDAEAVSFPPSAPYRALNPLGNVPFLQDGAVEIGESVAIMLYLAERYGPTPLLPKDDPARMARVLQFTVFGEASIGGAMNGLMATKFTAPEADKRNWSVNMLEKRVEQFLGFVESTLGDRPYLVGDGLTLADICIVTAFGMWRGALDKTLSPTLAAYQARLQVRPAYARALAKQAR